MNETIRESRSKPNVYLWYVAARDIATLEGIFWGLHGVARFINGWNEEACGRLTIVDNTNPAGYDD